jgi:hypothetical protein
MRADGFKVDGSGPSMQISIFDEAFMKQRNYKVRRS